VIKARLEVRLPGRRVGELVQDRTGLVRWEPDRSWEAGGQHPRLGAVFLLNPGVKQAGTGLLSWFENLLPERGSELRRRFCELHSLRDGQSFALLGALGRDLLGAVEVHAVGSDLGDLAPSDEPAIVREEGGPLRLSALTGAQMKFSMSMVGERLVLSAQGAQSYWIVKFPGDRFEELPEVERATMSWARAAGFEVPEHFTPDVTSLVGIPPDWIGGATRAFAIKRFDRRADGTKVHQEDLCQALDVLPGNKYGDTLPRVSFDGALRFVTDIAGEAQGREMARRMGFVLASGNGDAHLKNWSLLWGAATRPKLTPCYDLVSTISWPDLGWERSNGPEMALSIGGERLFRRIGVAALDAFSTRSRRAWAKGEVLEGIARAKQAWRQIADEAPERMRCALETHWEAVPILREVGRPC
jgi:serine/threonine-protein kinase HipA